MDHDSEFRSREPPTAFPLSNVIVSSIYTPNPRRAIPPSSDQFDSEANQSLSNPAPNSNVNNNLDASSSHVPNSSTTSDAVPPHLKRKHGHKHMRQQLHSARASSQTSHPLLSTDTVFPSPNPQVNANQPSPSRLSQLQIGRSNTVPSPKRPPASHSSYPVETIAGPPPSFDTRRTLSQERVWRVDRSKSLRMTLGSDRPVISSQSQPQSLPVTGNEPSDTKDSAPVTPLLIQSSPDTADTQSVPTPTDAEEVPVMETRSDHGLGVSNSEGGSKTSSESHKSEDLFLNIARVDAGRPSSSKGEKRRSRISLPFFSSARPATSYNPEATHLQADAAVTTPRAGIPLQHVKRASLQFGQTRSLDQNSEHGSTDVSNSGHYSKRSSTLYADTIRAPQRASTGLRSSRLVSEGGYLDRARVSEQNATESTASTTAPSTVWDELDDLKSRIRKLELTGKLPPSSAAAMSSAERPRTATTAATTMSSSPKHNKVTTNLQSTIEGTPSNTHPLLHEALGNAQAVVSHEIYQKLQATAQDALQLTSFTNIDTQSDRSGMPFAVDRQLRRRTESLCRNLTELAIALATETKSAQSTYRPMSREYHASPSMGPRSRRYSNSNEPADRPPISNRVASRLETRKASTQIGYPNTRRISTDIESPAGTMQYPGSGARSARNSIGYQSRRFLDGANDEEQNSPSVRPMSRAMTDISTARHLSRDHAAASREYTRQHPMPSQIDSPSNKRTPLPSHLSTNFISRRKNPSPAATSMADSSPLATRPSWGRISVVHQDAVTPSDTVSEAPGSSRSVSTRRSFGLASRIGSSVGNRLRSAKMERVESRTFKDSPTARVSEGGTSEEALPEQQYS